MHVRRIERVNGVLPTSITNLDNDTYAEHIET